MTELGFSNTQGFFSLPQEGFRQISQILHLLGRQLQHSPLKFLPINWHSLSPLVWRFAALPYAERIRLPL